MLKEPKQPYTHLFFRLQFACYHYLFAERNSRCPLLVEASLSSLHKSTHENSWIFVPKKSLYILESRGLEKTSKWPRPSVNPPSLCSSLNHSPVCHFHIPSEHFQGRWFQHLPRQAVPMPYYPFREEFFPIIQSKPPMTQLEAISTHPVTCHLWKETPLPH